MWEPLYSLETQSRPASFIASSGDTYILGKAISEEIIAGKSNVGDASLTPLQVKLKFISILKTIDAQFFVL
jgi:hypothetical protein